MSAPKIDFPPLKKAAPPQPHSVVQATTGVDAHRAPEATGKLFAFTSGTELLSKELPPEKWLFSNMLTEGVAVIGGQPKSTKTWAECEIAVSAATCTNAFGGKFTNQLPAPVHVLLWLSEDSERNSRQRIKAICAGKGVDVDDAMGRMTFMTKKSINLFDSGVRQCFIDSVNALPNRPAIVILDGIRKVFSLEHENNPEFNKVGNCLEEIRQAVGAMVVSAVHHMTKDPVDGKNTRRGGQRLSGGAALHGTVDCGFYMKDCSKKGDTRSCVVEIENRAGEEGNDFALHMNMKKDHTGDAIAVTWEAAGTAGAGIKAADGELKAAISVALQKRLIFAGEDMPVPLSARQLAKLLKTRPASLAPILDDMRDAGEAVSVTAKQTPHGKAGWVHPKWNEQRPPAVLPALLPEQAVLPDIGKQSSGGSASRDAEAAVAT